nr:hypothetical protein [Mycoplasmopsis bovis]
MRSNASITKPIMNAIDHSLFWILYLVLSIPIFVFGWKKLGRVYILLSLEFLVLSSLVSAGLGQIPALNQFTLFGKFNHPEITENMKMALVNHAGWNSENINDLIKLLPLQWNDGGNTIVQILFCNYLWYFTSLLFCDYCNNRRFCWCYRNNWWIYVCL